MFPKILSSLRGLRSNTIHGLEKPHASPLLVPAEAPPPGAQRPHPPARSVPLPWCHLEGRKLWFCRPLPNPGSSLTRPSGLGPHSPMSLWLLLFQFTSSSPAPPGPRTPPPGGPNPDGSPLPLWVLASWMPIFLACLSGVLHRGSPHSASLRLFPQLVTVRWQL